MQNYWLVKIGSVYLTDDGLSTGSPCRVEVTGLSTLYQDYAISMRKSADNTPYGFTIPTNGRGVDITVKIVSMGFTQFDAIMNEINTALAGEDTISMEISQGTTDFTFDALPGPVQQPGSFVAGRLNNAEFNFTVVAKTA